MRQNVRRLAASILKTVPAMTADEPQVATEAELPSSLAAAPVAHTTVRPLPPAPPPTVTWEEGQRESWRARLPPPAWQDVASALGLSADVARYVFAEGESPAVVLTPPTGKQIGLWRSRPWLDLVLGLGPVPVTRLLNLHAEHWRATPEAFAGFIATFELAAIDAILRLPAALLDHVLPALAPLADVRLAEHVARRLTQVERNSDKGVATIRWLTTHSAHTCWALVASATQDEPRARAARTALRWLSEHGLGAEIARTAWTFGIEPSAMTTEPMALVKVPSFWRVDRSRPPVLHNGKRVPDAAIERLATLLLATKPEPIDEIRGACREESLRDFALDVFAAFMRGSSTSVDLWPNALLAFAGEEAVAVLEQSLRQEKVRESRPLAAAVCTVLETIGSASAISALGATAYRPRPADRPAIVQEAADGALERLAKARAVTSSELAAACFPQLRTPLSQVERDAFRLTPEEAASTEVVRFEGMTMSTRQRLPAGWRLGIAKP